MIEQIGLDGGAVEGDNITNEGKSGLQELANSIKAYLNHYLSGGVEAECVGCDCLETIGVINRYQKKIEELLVAFYESKEADKFKIQMTFIDELNRYNNEVHTSIGF